MICGRSFIPQHCRYYGCLTVENIISVQVLSFAVIRLEITHPTGKLYQLKLTVMYSSG